LDLLQAEQFDLLCHHAADVTNYRSPEFAVCRAVAANTHRGVEVLRVLAESSHGGLMLTGSVFEGGEGAGSEGLPHFSPYGLSKAMTAEFFQYYCETLSVRFGKFVIPNPFGPWEDPRFGAYLMRSWEQGETPMIRTPDYVRDNIHVSLLAAAYVAAAERLAANEAAATLHFSPSGYVESQGRFAERFAGEMRSRLGWDCPVAFARQTEFPEPRVRINCEPVDGDALGWDESAAWDGVAAYYAQQGVPS
jgi:nucleoside-diphosphate-sugar epimerase